MYNVGIYELRPSTVKEIRAHSTMAVIIQAHLHNRRSLCGHLTRTFSLLVTEIRDKNIHKIAQGPQCKATVEEWPMMDSSAYGTYTIY